MAVLAVNDIEGTLYWPFLRTFNTKFNADNTKYQVDMGNLSKKAVKVLTEMGIEVRNKSDEKEDFITVRSKFHVAVLDEDGDEIDATKVGNGTKASVKVQAYNTMGFPDRVFNGMGDITVTSLVTYNASSGDAPITPAKGSNSDLDDTFS
jgi:hypothetical protein